MKSISLLTLTLLCLSSSSVLSAPVDTSIATTIYDRRTPQTDEKRAANTVDEHYYPQAHTGWGSWGKTEAHAASAAEKAKRAVNTVDDHYYPQAHTGWGIWNKAEGEKAKRAESTVDDYYYPQAHTGWGSWNTAEEGASKTEGDAA